jgi:hypothetical protein
MDPTPVYLEIGKKSVFAVSLEWPGWCRRARTSELALEELAAYRERYAPVAGESFVTGPFEIVGTVTGNATTDFGAPSVPGPWDERVLNSKESAQFLDVLCRCWNYFDDVTAHSTATLRKGPRGGGRDRDAVIDHVREAERRYASKLGVRVAPRTAWEQQRSVIAAGLAGADSPSGWPRPYTIRRIAWHVMDHAWEIEDKSGKA